MKKLLLFLSFLMFSCNFNQSLDLVNEEVDNPIFNNLNEIESPFLSEFLEFNEEFSSNATSFIEFNNKTYFISNMKYSGQYKEHLISFDLFYFDNLSKEIEFVNSISIPSFSFSKYTNLYIIDNELYIIASNKVFKLLSNNNILELFSSFSIFGSYIFNNRIILDYRLKDNNNNDLFYISSFDKNFENEEELSFIDNGMRLHILANIIEFDNKFVFYCDGLRYCISDATSAGTKLLNQESKHLSVNSKPLIHNSKIYWIENLGTTYNHNYKLLSSDGNTLSIIETGEQVTRFFGFINNKLVAVTKDYKLLVEDNGVFNKHNLNIDKEYSLEKLFVLDDYVIYIAKIKNTNIYEIWSSDGTIANTKLIKTLYSQNKNGLNIHAEEAKIINNKLFFYFRDIDYGFEPFICDGTSSGTMILKNINKNSSSLVNSSTVSYNNKLFFIANNEQYGSEIWFTDTTTNTSNLLIDLRIGSLNSSASLYYVKDNTLFASYINEDGKFKLINIDLDF